MIQYITNLLDEHSSLFKSFFATEQIDNDYFKKYLILHSLEDQKNGNAQTYLLIQENDNGEQELLGFYSLRASSLILEDDNFTKLGEPAIEIYELAVKKDLQKHGIGSKLIKDAIARIYKVSKIIGIKHILVCAKNNAENFYKRYYFMKIPVHKEMPRSQDNITCVPMFLSLSIVDE